MDTDIEISEGAMASMNLQSSTEIAGMDTDGTQDLDFNQDASAPLFFVDTAGDPGINSAVPTTSREPVARSPSPAPSDSSDEVVVFHGRNRPAQVVNDPVTRPANSSTKQRKSAQAPVPVPEPHITDGLLAALEQLPGTTPRSPSPSKPPSPFRAKGWAAQPAKIEETSGWQAAPAIPYWKKDSVYLGDGRAPKNAEETIASLQSELRGTSGQSPKASRRGKRGRKKDNRQMRTATTSDDDDGTDAAYADYMENLKAQLDAGDEMPSFAAAAVASAVNGPSMVVNGQEIGEDELLGGHEEDWESDDSSEDGPIGQDESEFSDEELNLSDMDSSELEERIGYTQQEQWDDEDDLRQRRIQAMDDEQLARLWAKQIELGIEDDELIIDDGIFGSDDSDEGVGDVDEARAGLADITNSAFGQRAANKAGLRRSRRGHKDLAFPDASALADTVEQYGDNGFDIMDYERPSLRPRKKGKKGKLPEELDMISDEDLRDEMAGAWENDRAKKRLKKAEREELRMQGMLGSTGKKGKADLGQKYLYGMNLSQTHEELRVFLQDDGQRSRPFPPMDKRDRKALHELADKFNLKSKSVGSGNNRFPVLYKTNRTVEYSEAHFTRMVSNSGRSFFKNSAAKGKKGAGKLPKRGPGRGGGFDKSAVSLRPGEIVGGGAAEIGRESMGHRLMEKMGWSRGQALGKEGEGMLTPVEQIMRSGKAGLG